MAATKKFGSGEASSEMKVPSKEIATKSSSGLVKKTRRGGTKPVAAKQTPGKLCQLNLDVLFLIAAYVGPGGLLNLARTCRSLRELLMDKYSLFVWKMARSATGMPDCPPDLTEPQYANLVFCSSCHACGKYTPTIFWNVRRRYCSDCKSKRLVSVYDCHEVIRHSGALATEQIKKKESRCVYPYVDSEQMDSFMSEYNHSSDKDLFIREKRSQVVAICQHANAWMTWHKNDLKMRRQERETHIFERLRQHGYEPEINFFSQREIKRSRGSLFKSSKPITDKEWAQMWPEWLKTMDKFRNERLDIAVYRPRQNRLLNEYADYVERPQTDGRILDFLPHDFDLVHFPPFRDIIKAPEGTELGDKPFESAFAQLPMLVDEWRKEFDAQLAELVEIPSHLSLGMPPGDHAAGSSKIMPTESSQSATDKLHLACAVFTVDCPRHVFLYPEILSAMKHRGSSVEKDPKRAASIKDRFYVRHLDDAPYIVRACGLDPNVATVEDMDHRNARLRCLCCRPEHILGWRDAMMHARSARSIKSYSIETRWEIADCEYPCAAEPAERFTESVHEWMCMRCLLCRPRVGDSLSQKSLHFCYRHKLEANATHPEPGVNCIGLEMRRT